MLLAIHVIAGGLAIILGALALLARKGGTIHRKSGLLFVYVMAAMSISAAVLGVQANQIGNVFAALMTIYFVVTATMTVRPATSWTRTITIAALLVALVIAATDIAAGVTAFNSPRRSLNGVPFFMLFFMASVMLMAAIGDVRVLRSGALKGGQRLSRHLWRMCFALFIAAGSFFSIRARVAKVLPEPFLSWQMRMLPILLVFAAMFYWMWKVRGRRPLRVQLRDDAMTEAARAK